MKSMLQEAATIAKAVEKAWETAGKPEEFSIKVLDAGEKGFFGLFTKPAIISITYEPNRTNRRPSQSSSSQRPTRSGSSGSGRDARASLKHVSAEEILRHEGQQPRNNQRDQRRNNDRPQHQRAEQPRREQSAPRQESQVEHAPRAEQHVQNEQQPYWNDELINDIQASLKEIVTIMQVTSPFAFSHERQLLTITFAESTIDEAEAEKMLYTSVSYLLLQFLKKKHRRRFKGYCILMISPTCGRAAAEKEAPADDE